MKISYDKEFDSMYIRLLDGEYQCRTLRLNEEIALNIGEGEKLVGIEILEAGKSLGQGDLPKLFLENIPYQIIDIMSKSSNYENNYASGVTPTA
jgi:uncharacterized protein YuzE